jgi:hypothetical protein
MDVRHGRYVVHIGLIDHCRHRFGDIPFNEFVQAVLVPYGFEVEQWTI